MRMFPQWKRLLVFGCALALAVAVMAAYALLRTPGWYAPPIIAVDDRQLVRNNLVAAEQAMTENLIASSGPFTYHLYQDDLNRWISMRKEIYPLIDELAPPQLAEPFVLFDEGGVTLAGRYRAGVADVVISIDIEVLFEHDEIVLRARRIRCGSVGLSLNFEGLPLSRPVHREPEQTWPGSPSMTGDFVHGLRIGSQAWWKNGGMEYRVRGVKVKPGQIDIDIEPMGRHHRKRKEGISPRRSIAP